MAYEGSSVLRAECFSACRVLPEWKWAWDGLVAAVPGWETAGGPIELVEGLVGTLSGATVPTYSMGFGGPEIASGGVGYISFGDATEFRTPLYGPVTAAAIHSPAATTSAAIWQYAGVTSIGAPFSLMYSWQADGKYGFWNDNNANGPTGATVFGAGSRNFVLGRRNGNNTASPTLDIFVNGIKLGTTTSTIIDANWNSADSGYLQCINRFGGYNGYIGTGAISAVMVWNRWLSDAEVEKLSNNPYGPFLQRRTEYSFLGAAGLQSFPAFPPNRSFRHMLMR